MRRTGLALIAPALVAIAAAAITVTAAMLTIAELALVLVVALAVLAKALTRTITLLAVLAPFTRGRTFGCLCRGVLVFFAEIAPSVMAMTLALVAFACFARRACCLLTRLAVVMALMMAMTRFALIHAAAWTPDFDELRLCFCGGSRFGGGRLGRCIFARNRGFRWRGLTARSDVHRRLGSGRFLMQSLGSRLNRGSVVHRVLIRHGWIGFCLESGLFARSRRQRYQGQQAC